jgi:hypothetical protein
MLTATTTTLSLRTVEGEDSVCVRVILFLLPKSISIIIWSRARLQGYLRPRRTSHRRTETLDLYIAPGSIASSMLHISISTSHVYTQFYMPAGSRGTAGRGSQASGGPAPGLCRRPSPSRPRARAAPAGSPARRAAAPAVVSPSIHPSITLSIHRFVHPPIHLFTYSSISLSIYPSICPSIHPSIHLFIYPSIHLSIYPSIYLSLSLSLSLSLFLSLPPHTPSPSCGPPRRCGRGAAGPARTPQETARARPGRERRTYSPRNL